MSEISNPESALVPPRFLFRFAVEVRRCHPIWTPEGITLDEKYSLPRLSDLDSERAIADVRMAWGPQGLAWWVKVEGKSQLPWCRDSRLEDSDGLQVWVDTRATTNIHRASQFCHRFAYLPTGGGPTAKDPVADQLLINRARENARPVRPRELQAKATVTKTGYEMAAFAPAVALYGYDPDGSPKLGFTYALLDRERGLQTLSIGPGFPYEEDPSCWAEARLVE